MTAPSEYGIIVPPEEAKGQIVHIPETVCYSLNGKVRMMMDFCHFKMAPEPRKGIAYHGHFDDEISLRGEYLLIGKLLENPEIEMTLRGGSVSNPNESGVAVLSGFTPMFRIGLQYAGNDMDFRPYVPKSSGIKILGRRFFGGDEPNTPEERFPLLNKAYGAEIYLAREHDILRLELNIRDSRLEELAKELYERVKF